MTTISNIRPPFNEETAKAKVKAAQDAWNTRNPELVSSLKGGRMLEIVVILLLQHLSYYLLCKL